MNSETNRFEPLLDAKHADRLRKQFEEKTALLRPDGSDVPKHWPVFRVGEEISLKGYSFKVAYIGETSILFEPVGIPLIGKDSSG